MINSINAFGGVNIGGSEGSNFPLDPYLNPFDWFSGSKPEIAWYITTHKSRGAHDVYCGVQGICGAIVTQQGNIILAQSDGGGDEDDGDAILEEAGEGRFNLKHVCGVDLGYNGST